MSNRELVVLGTASQAPTRSRNHSGYFLRWDDEGLLFDSGEGTQRQMLFAGVTASQVTRICITHSTGTTASACRAFALADRADMLVCESTFANAEAGLAADYGHLTAGQAGQIAAQSGTRLLVLTHFSQRYDFAADGDKRLAGEAAEAFGGEVMLARDLDRIPVPPRCPAPAR